MEDAYKTETRPPVEVTFTVSLTANSAANLKPLLEECGYTGTRLKEGYAFGSMTIPYVGFATKPWDFDSACIAVMVGNGDSEATARSCRGMGAPIVWVNRNSTVDWWVQHAGQPKLFESKPADEFPAFVRTHKNHLDPVSVYRGKTIARIDKSRQLDFVDMGLLPLLREEAGAKLHELVEEMTRAILTALGGGEPTKKRLRDVFTAVFRLLAGKILKDKGVRGFKGLDLTRPVDVLFAVTKHYDKRKPTISIPDNWKTALASAVSLFSGAGSFGAVSPETLAYVYEHTLVTKSLRKKLGIHATPPWLVDYMVWQMYDWIREIPAEDRHVFEPACGHAPFLLSAMRLLRLEVQDRNEAEVHDYLKSHIHGVEIDDFAREIARLSLTLADIPNPDGWDLRDGNMFASNVLMSEASRCRILLCNPPYEAFEEDEKATCENAGFPVNRPKAIELMNRTLPNLPERALFALILPQVVLHGTEARASRDALLNDFDLREICLFADKVFAEGEPESVVLLGRRRPAGKDAVRSVRYCHVRENGVRRFAESYEPDSQLEALTDRFKADPHKSFRVPDLLDVWTALRKHPTLSNVADVGQGFSFARKGLIALARRLAKHKTADAVPAFLHGHTNANIWSLPLSSWLSPARTRVAPWRSGDATGKPQVVVNYIRAMRGPWRIKAFLDNAGHAAINTYLTVRPKTGGPSIQVLWAILNSPVGNAYAYCNTMQKHIYDGLIADLPLPVITRERCNAIETAASAYLAAVEASDAAFMQVDATNAVKRMLLALDAEVLKLYDLPPRLERQLLDLFTGVERKGVGCDFRGYYPPGFTSYLPLHEILSDRFQIAKADVTADRFKPGESEYVRQILNTAAFGTAEEE
ncbi:MAG: N-6 DNA methylase [Planctomycetes bacterium]|nr:N-6 DNA methylase [Planctomycetota bacterium]